MPHMQQRIGSREELSDDYVVCLTMANESLRPQMVEAARILLKYVPVNLGIGHRFCVKTKNVDFERIVSELKDEGRHKSPIKPQVHAVYTDVETVKAVVKDLVEKVPEIPITLSGLFKEIQKLSKDIAIEMPDTAKLSLPILGKTKLLPQEEILKVTTMCGHQYVPTRLVEKVVQDIKQRRMSLDEAADELARTCRCGVFNPARARKILARLATQT